MLRKITMDETIKALADYIDSQTAELGVEAFLLDYRTYDECDSWCKQHGFDMTFQLYVAAIDAAKLPEPEPEPEYLTYDEAVARLAAVIDERLAADDDTAFSDEAMHEYEELFYDLIGSRDSSKYDGAFLKALEI